PNRLAVAVLQVVLGDADAQVVLGAVLSERHDAPQAEVAARTHGLEPRSLDIERVVRRGVVALLLLDARARGNDVLPAPDGGTDATRLLPLRPLIDKVVPDQDAAGGDHADLVLRLHH